MGKASRFLENKSPLSDFRIPMDFHEQHPYKKKWGWSGQNSDHFCEESTLKKTHES